MIFQVMKNTRSNARSVEDGDGEKEIPPQVPNWRFSLRSIRNTSSSSKWTSNWECYSWWLSASMQVLDQALVAQANWEVVDSENLIGGIGASRVTKFLWLNPTEFNGSMVEEDANGFINEIYKVLAIMGVSLFEKVDLSSYKLKKCCLNLVWSMKR